MSKVTPSQATQTIRPFGRSMDEMHQADQAGRPGHNLEQRIRINLPPTHFPPAPKDTAHRSFIPKRNFVKTGQPGRCGVWGSHSAACAEWPLRRERCCQQCGFWARPRPKEGQIYGNGGGESFWSGPGERLKGLGWERGWGWPASENGGSGVSGSGGGSDARLGAGQAGGGFQREKGPLAKDAYPRMGGAEGEYPGMGGVEGAMPGLGGGYARGARAGMSWPGSRWNAPVGGSRDLKWNVE